MKTQPFIFPDKNIRLALLPTPRIEEKIYCLEKDEVKIIDSVRAYQALEFDEMPYRERKKLFNDLAKKH